MGTRCGLPARQGLTGIGEPVGMCRNVPGSKDAGLDAVYEYALFTLVCVCVLREAFSPLEQAASLWYLQLTTPTNEHDAWLEHISRARQQDLLGPLRLEERSGTLCAVGMGECLPVQSIEEGTELIQAIKDGISGLFDDAPTPA